MKKRLLKVYPAIVTILFLAVGIVIILNVAGLIGKFITGWPPILQIVVGVSIGIAGTIELMRWSFYIGIRLTEYRDDHFPC